MEFLKEALGDELYAQVEAKLKDNKKIKLANLETGDYVGKDKFKSMADRAEQAEAQLKERDKQLEELKKTAGSNTDLKEQIGKLQQENEKVKADFETKIAAQAKEFAVETAVLKANGKNPKAIKALLDMEKVKIDGDKVLGLDDQITALQKSDAYLFGTDTGGNNPPANPPDPGAGGKLAQLKQQYADAEKRRDAVAMMQIAGQIKQAQKK